MLIGFVYLKKKNSLLKKRNKHIKCKYIGSTQSICNGCRQEQRDEMNLQKEIRYIFKECNKRIQGN